MDFGDLKMYVGGKLINATNNNEKIILCPADNKPIAKLSWANEVDAEKALVSADKGFKYWSKLSHD